MAAEQELSVLLLLYISLKINASFCVYDVQSRKHIKTTQGGLFKLNNLLPRGLFCATPWWSQTTRLVIWHCYIINLIFTWFQIGYCPLEKMSTNDNITIFALYYALKIIDLIAKNMSNHIWEPKAAELRLFLFHITFDTLKKKLEELGLDYFLFLFPWSLQHLHSPQPVLFWRFWCMKCCLLYVSVVTWSALKSLWCTSSAPF